MNTKIKSIALGKSQTYIKSEKAFDSAYKKDQFSNSIEIDKLGLKGDVQVDIRYHGGMDKAIHFGSIKHLESNPKFDKLSIGCNIFIDNLDENDICIGDVYKIGEVEVEVTQPRQPCWKIGALFGKEVSRYISRNHATGWYVRVKKEGRIFLDNEMILEKRVSNLTIKNLSEYLKVPPINRKIIDEILTLKTIAESYKKDFLKSLESNNS